MLRGGGEAGHSGSSGGGRRIRSLKANLGYTEGFVASLNYIGLYLKREEGEGVETGQTQVCVNVNSAHSLIHSSKSKKVFLVC